ncbi:hypothetical protein GOV06_02780 [Candidatus Woesearchaeota archaeon]|nr:hypothetical protein [Candidatus Woesearchaeota archaeon]
MDKSLEEIIIDGFSKKENNYEPSILKNIEIYYSSFLNENSKKIKKENINHNSLNHKIKDLDSIVYNQLEENPEEFNQYYIPQIEQYSKFKEKYTSYDKEEMKEYIFNNKENIESLEKLLGNYTKAGYSVKKESEAPKTKAAVSLETAESSLPDEYKPVLAMLAQEHPGIRYSGIVSLADQSQHNVDILTFEYEENGALKQLHIVAKDADEKEEILPQFLNDLGIKTHTIYDRNTRLLINHVGEQELRNVVKQGSDSEVLDACGKALDKISQIHVLASLNLPELREHYGLSLELTDYNTQFRSRFVTPVSGNSVIVSPQAHDLMQAYSAFTKTFDPRHFTHGDFHIGNCRMSEEECFIVDYEAAKIGRKFDDLARFTNSVIRDRSDMDPAEFSRDMLHMYVDKHNEHSAEHKTPLLLPNTWLSTALRYSLINDQIDKCGGAIIFAKEHPKVKDEQMQKCKLYFEKAISMIDGALTQNPAEAGMLSNLRTSLVDFAAESPVEILKQTAENYKAYKQYKEPLVVVPAA